LKHVESDDQVRAIINSLINALPSVTNRNFETAVEMIISVLTSKPVDFSTFTFKQHPVKRVMDLHIKDCEKKYCLLLSELVTCHLNSSNTVRGNFVLEPSWRHILEKFNIPEIAQLDLVGFYLYTLNFPKIGNYPVSSDRLQCCDSMKRIVKRSICYNRRKVLNPIIALILNICQKNESHVDPTSLYLKDGFMKFMSYTIKFHLTGTYHH
jgi:hypothetical protein